jgi:hypothetical protein
MISLLTPTRSEVDHVKTSLFLSRKASSSACSYWPASTPMHTSLSGTLGSKLTFLSLPLASMSFLYSTGASALRWPVTPSFKAKPNATSMRTQESSLHTYHIENGYRIINVSICSIYYTNNVLQKTKSNTFDKIVAERHHNSIGNRPGAIARLVLLITESKIFFRF